MSLIEDGIVIVLSSPSGAGKTTLVKKISKKNNFQISISYTTRIPRDNEVNGSDYYFIKKSFFDFKGKVTKSNVTKFIKYMGPCFEIVGFRQRNKKFTYLGDICGDFGFNIKFVVGRKTKFKKLNLNNLNHIKIIASNPNINAKLREKLHNF